MVKWQMAFHMVTLEVGNIPAPQVSDLWNVKDKNGQTTHDKLQKLAADGWELVSVTPIQAVKQSILAGVFPYTHQLLFTFKRPISED